MNEKQTGAKRSRRLFLSFGVALGLVALALVSYIVCAIPFLSVTDRVEANVLVVEGWLEPRLMPPVAAEFHRNHYSLILISGILHDQSESNPAASEASLLRTLAGLEQLGVPPDKFVLCPAPFAEWRRTAKSARGVRAKLLELGLKPTGLNVITDGTHARESWVAYQHMFGRETPVGVIAIPPNDRPGRPWWTSRARTLWVTKDFLGWLKEVIFPLRS